MTTASRGALLAASPTLAAILVAVAVGLLPVATIGIGEGIVTGHIVDAYVLRIFWFTLLQAGLSTLLSVAFAIPVALALARVDFRGRRFLLRRSRLLRRHCFGPHALWPRVRWRRTAHIRPAHRLTRPAHAVTAHPAHHAAHV